MIGAITISKLGVGQFDEDDLRLLEVLAGHASVALENARLYESLRREADNAKAWLEFADAVSEARSIEAIGDETVRTRRAADGGRAGARCGSRIRTRRTTAASRRSATTAIPAPRRLARALRTAVRVGAELIDGRKTPFVVGADEIRADLRRRRRSVDVQPGGGRAARSQGFGIRGWITVRAPAGDLAHFTDERLRLLEGLAYRASVALQKSVLLQSEQESAEVAERAARVLAPARRDRQQRRAPAAGSSS